MATSPVYVANVNDGTISKIDTSTFTVVGSALAIGGRPSVPGTDYGPYVIAIDPAGTYAYVANYNTNNVTKISLASFTVVGSLLTVGAGPQSIVIDPAGTYAYTSNYTAGTVTKINLSTFTTVGSALAVGNGPFSIVAAVEAAFTAPGAGVHAGRRLLAVS
jgi:DNA-binding beta-propeller fold protein YncE